MRIVPERRFHGFPYPDLERRALLKYGYLVPLPNREGWKLRDAWWELDADELEGLLQRYLRELDE